jgi:hypothetical protein
MGNFIRINNETISHFLLSNYASCYQHYPLNKGDSLGHLHSIISNFIHLVLQRSESFRKHFKAKNCVFDWCWLRCGYWLFNFKLFFMTHENQKKLAKIFVLTDLLIQEIDGPTRTPTKQTKAIQDKAKELQKMLEPVLDGFYKSKEVQKSTFFITMQNKFNYIFDKEFR